VAYIFLPEHDPRREQMRERTAEFKAGDKVKYRGMVMPAEVLSGPHKTPGNPRYLISKADGNVTLAYAAHLERVVPRIDQVAELLASIIYTRPFAALDARTQLRLAHTANRVLTIADETKGQA
jgi:hypothetical protein